MTQHEWRQHPRYLLRLSVQLRRGDEVLSADVVNASAGGCLLQVSEPLTPGEALEVSLPELRLPRARLLVLRCDLTSMGYMVSTYFEPPLVDGLPLPLWAEEPYEGAEAPWLN